MPSNRPVIAVRLEKPLYDKVAALANAQGRSLSNLVESMVRKQIDNKSKSAQQK